MKVQLLPSLCALSGLLIAATASAQVAYTWVDKDGVVHFSDTPNQGAKAISLPNLESSAPAPKVESTESLAPQAKTTSEPTTDEQTKAEKPLKNIDRGTHTLAVQAKRSGKLIASTSPITVHLHRASIKPTIKGAK